MIKKILKISLILLLIIGSGWAVYYNFKKDNAETQLYKTQKPIMTSIKRTAVAAGELKPKTTIDIKPNIAGVIDKLYVNAGDQVSKGALIATVRVIPDVQSLNSAQQQIRTAEINVALEKKNYTRQKYLYDEGVISKLEFDNSLNLYQQAQQNLRAAEANYKVALSGIAPGLEKYATTQIRATISGMILSVPVEVGNTVQQINNFSVGTTIATMADINQMMFEGKVDEAEVGKLQEGMKINIRVGALPNQIFEGNLYFISPSGETENGIVQFTIKANVLLKSNVFLRAGYSANAEFVVDRVEKTLAINESLLQYEENGDAFVEVKKGDTWEKRKVTLGVTDNINVQILSGLSQKDEIKVWNTDSKEEEKGRKPRK